MLFLLFSLETMFCKWQRHTPHRPAFKQIINHKVILEGKKHSISNHDLTAFGLTFVLFGKSPKLKMLGELKLTDNEIVFFRGLFSYFFGELCRLGHLETKTSKPLLFEMHPHFSNLCLHLRKESTRCVILYLIKDFNSTMEQLLYWTNPEHMFYFIIYLIEEM